MSLITLGVLITAAVAATEWLIHGQRKARKSRADLLRRLRAGRTHLIATAA